jgi:hypothetical protein
MLICSAAKVNKRKRSFCLFIVKKDRIEKKVVAICPKIKPPCSSKETRWLKRRKDE